MYHFPISGVETYWWLPAAVAFAVSFLSSTGGLSGAFLLLPFQVSVLGFTTPGVSPTNMFFNIVAIPSGVYRYWREKRMVWPLAGVIITGTIPGVFLGAFLRVKFLPDPKAFKFFAGLVLLYIGSRLARDLIRKSKTAGTKPFTQSDFKVGNSRIDFKRISYEFEGESFSVSTWSMVLLSLAVGVVGGAYGIGGGAIIVPILVAVYRLPVYTIAGAALLSTFTASVAGVGIYGLIDYLQFSAGTSAAPDWQLGAMFGIGGFFGIYLGARAQKYLPDKVIKAILTVLLLFVSVKYIAGFLL